MSFGCSRKKLVNAKNFKDRIINTQMVTFEKFKNWPTTVTQKLTHKRYSKIDPQMLLKK